MDDWAETSSALLDVPWAACQATNDQSTILIKAAIIRNAASDARFVVVVHAQNELFVDELELSGRTLERSIRRGMTEMETQESQIIVAAMLDSSKEVREQRAGEILGELAAELIDGRANVEMTRESYDCLLSITSSNAFCLRLVLGTLAPNRAVAFISQQLVVPLLGLSSALLQMASQNAAARPEDVANVVAALGASTADPMLSFSRLGGGAILHRHTQARQTGFTLADHSGSSSRSQTLQSPSRNGSPRKRSRQEGDALASSASPSKGIGRQMLARQPISTGERVEWDESQTQPDLQHLPAAALIDDEPDTDDESMPPAAQSRISASRPPSSSPPQNDIWGLHSTSRPTSVPPATLPGPSASGTPDAEQQDLNMEDVQDAKRRKKEDKERARMEKKAKEEAEELNERRKTLLRAQKAREKAAVVKAKIKSKKAL